MTTYVAYVTTGQEIATADLIYSKGFPVWIARKIEYVRGNNRRARPIERPYMPNYLFLTLSDDQWHSIHREPIKHLFPMFMPLTARDMDDLRRFQRHIGEQLSTQRRQAKNLDASELAEYTPGQRIEAIDGPFSDAVLHFREMVKRSFDLYPRIVAEMDLIGRSVPVELDPISVRAVE